MKKYILIISAAICLMSCNKYLDMTPTDRVSAKTMWETASNAEYSINYLWTYIWDFNAEPTTIGLTEALTDEMKYTSYNYNALCYIPSEASYGGQILTPSYVDSYFGKWGTLYTAIRQVNEGMNYLHAYGKMSSDEMRRLEGELYFIRGYFYFELVKRYHKVILYDEDLAAITKDKAVSDEEYYADYYRMLGDSKINSKLQGLVTNDRPDLHMVETDNLFSANVLYRLGFSWPLVDSSYLERAIESLLTLDYFEADEN